MPDRFVLSDYADRPAKDGFLSLNNVAAIIPDGLPEKDMLCFLIHLKNRPPFPVFAHSFDTGPTVTFKYHQKDAFGKPYSKWRIEGLYILPSEVVAILPSDGVGVYRRG